MSIGIRNTETANRRYVLCCFFNSHNGYALVLAALLAGTVRELLFAAVRAVGNSGRSQEVVATTLGCALFGVAPLRIRHGKTSSWAARTGVIAEP
jgi:outer membrane lipoprotein SlyB